MDNVIINILIELTTIVTTVVYASLVMRLIYSLKFKKKIGERDEAKRKFFKALLESLKIGAINTIDDIENVYKGIGVIKY